MGAVSTCASTGSARAVLGSWTQTPTPLRLSLSKPARCLGPIFLLAACSAGGDSKTAAQGGESIACALGGSLQFKPDCTVERSEADGAQVIVVRLPDGAFHRFEVSKDGQQLLAADGADQTKSALKEGRFEVILGPNRFVIPAHAKP